MKEPKANEVPEEIKSATAEELAEQRALAYALIHAWAGDVVLAETAVMTAVLKLSRRVKSHSRA